MTGSATTFREVVAPAKKKTNNNNNNNNNNNDTGSLPGCTIQVFTRRTSGSWISIPAYKLPILIIFIIFFSPISQILRQRN
jgi:hypothetical protein